MAVGPCPVSTSLRRSDMGAAPAPKSQDVAPCHRQALQSRTALIARVRRRCCCGVVQLQLQSTQSCDHGPHKWPQYLSVAVYRKTNE